MPCYHPLTAYRAYGVINGAYKPYGKPVFVPPCDCAKFETMQLPCGQCIGCRLKRSKDWAVRCVHEASRHEQNCFLTLTYNDDHLPSDGSLKPDDFVRFMKRFRKRFTDTRIRYFQCGEYGTLNSRPHHHACIFGFDFPDKTLHTINNGVPLYRSAILEELWPYGFCTVGAVTFESAAYVARYILKKVNGDAAEEHYAGRKPEYVTMSRRPGIARDWLENYVNDVYPHDYVVIRGGIKMRPPRYYDNIYDNIQKTVLTNQDSLDTIKETRRATMLLMVDNNTASRLAVREVVQKLKLRKLPRVL